VLRLPPFEDNETFYNHELALDPCNPPGLEHRAHFAARRGDLTRSRSYLDGMLTPPCVEKTRVHPTLVEKARAERLALRAATTPDGDVVVLGQLLNQLLGESAKASRQNLNLEAEIAVVATRLGRDGLAAEHLGKLQAGSLDELAAPANVVLAYARLGRYERARAFLERLGARDPAPLIDEQTRTHLAQRLHRAALLSRKARETAEPSAELLALAQAELGAYLRALRILGPSRGQLGQSAKVLFVQLLVMARLDENALRMLARETSEERARATLETLRASLPRDVVGLPRVPRTREPRFLAAD
jgi:tetratricopeptide (TPR) repeat protein